MSKEKEFDNLDLKPYVGTKIVRACKMSRNEFEATYKDDNKSKTTPVNDLGYFVVYSNGYKSWCPEDDFESANRALSPAEVTSVTLLEKVTPEHSKRCESEDVDESSVNEDSNPADEFYNNTGLLYFVNTFLHIFGWVLVYNTWNGKGEKFDSFFTIKKTHWRGFDPGISDESYRKVTHYMAKESGNLVKDLDK